ncbi:DM13 domain-containing protein [Mucilaginibacter dorajii]|uniref:DM13 domain-containing protein n=1 Tax=Mucilaginibacter dorajii TaxID=692994 RepID=A0ABP7QD38_9SPHI|nr:DM13 domain-containing protein [Mucilaginibacter dorajii]MCS3733178.1 hypothetical protein [Mucilaginibacter dorajii]
MKKYLGMLLIAAAFASCKKESTPTVVLNEKVDLAVATPKDTGTFVNGPYGNVKGTARIYVTEGKYSLALTDFAASNGPDLKVYLSKETDPQNFVNLGSLRSVNGNQVYDIPASVNVADYKYALIFCQQFKHLFGYSELKK